MRFVDRGAFGPVNHLFVTEEGFKNKESLVGFFASSEEKVSQSSMTTSDWVLWDEPITGALSELFEQRCAFCERSVSARDVGHTYRFRPVSEATPVQHTGTAHLYYLWLADAWQNLYCICHECRPENGTYFPVVSDQRAKLPNQEQLMMYSRQKDGNWPFYPLEERPVLLDPCIDQKLWRHFEFFGNGEVTGRDRRGRETIAHFSLNRPSLIDQRRDAFSEYIAEAFYTLEEMKQIFFGDLFDFGKSNFGGGWKILLRNLLANALDLRPSDDIAGRFDSLFARPDGRERFESAVEALSAPQKPLEIKSKPLETFTKIPSEVHIQNFKSLENLSFKLPTRATDEAASLLILGENAVGKSTILEAVAIALMGKARRQKLKLAAPDMVLNPRYMGAEGQQAPTQATVRLVYEDTHSQTLTLTSTARSKGAGFEVEGGENTLPLFAYGAFRHYLNAEKRFSQEKYVRSLFRPEHILSNPEKWLLRLSQDDFRMVARALRAVFSVEVEFDVLERDQKAKKVYVVAALDKQNGPKQRTPLSIVSSGFRSVMAVLCDIMQGLMDKRINQHFESLGSARGLVLIDEVEAHLHPRWKMSIMSGLRHALPQVTFIATSHDPLCLRGMKKDEVIVLERVSGAESGLDLPVFTQSNMDLPDHEFWTIEQLLTADFFQLRSTATDREKTMLEIERKLASGERDAQVETFLKEISDTLPIGDSEVHRLVQDAIADYLAARGGITAQKRASLRNATKRRIIRALKAAR